MAKTVPISQRLIRINSSEYCERTVDIILSERDYQRHLFLLHAWMQAQNAGTLIEELQ
jgi:hypothetical protein